MANKKQWSKDNSLSLKLFVVLARAVQAVEIQVLKDIKSHGLNLTEFSVLELLYHKGEQPIQKIGQKVLLASSSITYVVDKLEEKKYIQRKPCPNDRRVTYADLTEDGKMLMAEVFPKHKEAMDQIMGGLNEEEKTVAIDYLKKLGLHAQSL